jgi:hypothetical protein
VRFEDSRLSRVNVVGDAAKLDRPSCCFVNGVAGIGIAIARLAERARVDQHFSFARNRDPAGAA